MSEVVIERLKAPLSDADARALAALLVEAVQGGAAVSFLATLTLGEAEAWWRKTIASAHPRAVFLVARDGRPDAGEGRIVGTVQMHPAWAPNQPHRGEVAKLLVHRDARRCGLGTRLMSAVEEAARGAGVRLLTLDARAGGDAERLYRWLGWTCVGVIPDFAVDPDGMTPHGAAIFYKPLA